MKPSNGTVLSLPRLAALVLSLAFPQAAAAGTALVYDGPGLCEGCAEAAAAAVRQAGLKAVLAGPEALDPDRLEGFDLVVVGGAEATLDIRRGMSRAQFRALRNYVRGGGRYLGLCAGAYLAGEVLDDAGRVPGLRLFDGDAYPASPYAARVEPVMWEAVWSRFTPRRPRASSLVPGSRARSSPPMPTARRPRSSHGRARARSG